MAAWVPVRPRCDTCGSLMRPIDASTVATVVADRKCRKCGTKWRLVIRPQGQISGKGMFVHYVDLVKRQ